MVSGTLPCIRGGCRCGVTVVGIVTGERATAGRPSALPEESPDDIAPPARIPSCDGRPAYRGEVNLDIPTRLKRVRPDSELYTVSLFNCAPTSEQFVQQRIGVWW